MLIRLALAVLVVFIGILPVQAADLADGAKLFRANCAGCHLKGGNVLNGAKTLKLAALQKYEMSSIEAITYQVTHGKAQMPAFGSKLSAEQLDNVAHYVLNQAENEWK